GNILSYQTSQSGDRFKESQLKFTKQIDHDNADRVVLTLDKSKKFQKIFGIGAAFTDAAAINIGSLPNDMSDRVIKDYFSASGIGFSMARIPIGGTDYSTHLYTYDDTKDDYSLEHFTFPDEDIKYKIPQIKLAKEVAQHGLTLMGTPWNTPKWLNDKQFLDGYKKHGVEIWGLTMQNEPMSFSSMQFLNASIERDFIKKHLGPSLTKAGYTKDKMNLMVYDDGSDKNPMIEYVTTCLSDKDAAKYVTGIAFHCYLSNKYPSVDALHEKYPDAFTMMTECNQNSRHNTDPFTPATLGDWEQATNYANQIADVFHHWVSGWIAWNLALDTFGHPNKDLKMSDPPLVIDAKNKEYFKNPNFYAIGHYSKFVAPGSHRVELTASTTPGSFKPDNSVVIVLVNSGAVAHDMTIKDPAHGKVDILNASIEKKHLGSALAKAERPRLGIWDSGSDYVRQIIDDFKHYVSGWVEWNLALNVFGNPNKDKKMADAPLIIDVDNKEYYKNPQFYAIGHFSKFVAPDSVRVQLTGIRPPGGLNDANPVDITIDDPAHGKVDAHVPGQSIQSYIYWN
ncbi:unnamed protein product, partial [Oppiella nova]